MRRNEIYRRHFNSPEHELIEKYIRVNRLHRSLMENKLGGTGVYRSQHQLLMCVSDNPNISQVELARMHGVSGAAIAVSLKKLEKGGYIVREADEKDTRFNLISITEKGKKVVSDSVSIFGHIEQCMFDGFSEKDMKVMGELLDRIYTNLRREYPSPPAKEDNR